MNEVIKANSTGQVVPVAPAGLREEDEKEMQQEVSALVKDLDENTQSSPLSSKFDNLGAEAQRESARKMELLKGRVGQLLNDVNSEGSSIPRGLLDLRSKLDEINPHRLAQPGWFGKLIGRTPVIGKVLKNIAVRYEEINTQIDVIVNSLRDGQDKLEKDNYELDELYQQLRRQQLLIQKNAYMGEMLMQKLDDLLAVTEDGAKKQRIEAALNAVAMRTQDLRTMEQVNMQFFVSIDMTITNNKMLAQSITRTLTVTTNLITVGLSIQAALAKQKQVMEATKATQEYAAEILTANAASIKQNTQAIGDMYKNPVIALDKVKQAYNDLIASMDELEKVKRAGVASAKQGIAELSDLSAKLKPRMDALHEAGKVIDGKAEKEIEDKNT